MLLLAAMTLADGIWDLGPPAARLTASGAEETSKSVPSSRPASWAQPIEMAGVPNFHKVSDGLYRSAQPTSEGMENLEKLGIKTIVNLRSFHSDRDETSGTALRCEHLFMKAWHPEEKEVVAFLKIISDPKRQPVLVHCQHGADRTGMMCAIYRLAVQGWTKEEALKEMTEGGYNFHGVWQNLLQYVDRLDVAAIKRQAGLAEDEGKADRTK
jgi:protein tyrosine/serine phosphatase